VVAVSAPRTSSLVVTAASALMPQIAKLIEELDASPARKEIVQVYELRNADPQDVNQILQDIFNRNSTSRNNNNSSRNSLLGQGNPLTTRQTEQQNGSSSEASGFGATAGRGNAGGAGGGGGF
jgi:type II secretory pathway component GspD/PulD (secretin)